MDVILILSFGIFPIAESLVPSYLGKLCVTFLEESWKSSQDSWRSRIIIMFVVCL